MVKIYKICCVLLIFAIAQSGYAATVPTLIGRVNDYAKILSEETINGINSTLETLEVAESTQLVVLSVASLEGESIETYANKVFNTWQIGQKKLDNGILFLIAKDDRQLRIEVGRGIEGKLPDALAGRIIRDDIVPLLKNGDWNGGVTVGVNSIIKVVRGEYVATQNLDSQATTDPNKDPRAIIVVIFGFIMVGLIRLQKLLSKKTKLYVVAILPIIGTSIAMLFTSQILLIGLSALGGLLAAVLGLFVDWKDVHGGGSGGGSSSGGGYSGGGSSGGGYSGGGGSSGGGGASGRF